MTISGVAKSPTDTCELMFRPLRDDLAVLRVNPIPKGFRALDLALSEKALGIPRFSPIILLRFLLGSRKQATNVNVSATRGVVELAFDDLIQMEVSL